MREMSKKKKTGVIILAVVLLLAAAGYFTVDHMIGKIKRIKNEEILTPEEAELIEDEPEETGPIGEKVNKIVWPEVEPIDSGKRINILLVGQDRREGEGRKRSDTMLLCSIDTKSGEVDLISFLRDSYVQIPGYKDNRLNVPYLYGGFKLLGETLKTNYGVQVDGGFEVDFSSFEKIITLIGGVDIELTEKEAVYLDVGTVADKYHLNGTQALNYARCRHLDSDFGRTNRQRKLVSVILNKAKTLSAGELWNLADEILPMFSTNMSKSEVKSLLGKIIPMITKIELKQYHVPDQGEYKNAYIEKKSVLQVDNEAVNARLKTIIGR